MNTRGFCIMLIAVISSATSWGQVNINPAIEEKLENYIKLSNAGKYDQAFDLLYPKLFSRVPKQEAIDQLQDEGQAGMKVTITGYEIQSSSVPVEEGNETFVRLEYVADMRLEIARDGMYDSMKAQMALEQQLKATYGNPNVKYNTDDLVYTIRAHKSMMAIDGGNGDWKLVEINMDQPELMEYLFSPSIMEAMVRVN